MAPSVGRAALDRPRQMLSMRGEALGKKVSATSNDDCRRAFGAVLLRALALAGETPQSVAAEMGYANQTAVSKLLAADGLLTLAKLLALPQIRAHYIVALAETDPHFDTTTVLTQRRRLA